MKRTLVALIVVALATMASVASAQHDPTIDPGVRAGVVELLGSFEVEPTQKDWDKIGPGAADVLVEIAADPRQQPTMRSRAVSSLVHVESDQHELLQNLLANTDTPVIVRRKAMNVLAIKHPEAAIVALEPFVNSDQPRLRESAIRALGLVARPEARVLLQERLKVEPRKYLKDEIKVSLDRIDAAAP